MIDVNLKKKLISQGLCDTCEIIKGNIQTSGGTIFRSRFFQVNHSLEAPIPGLLMVSPIRHLYSISEFTPQELKEFGSLICRVRSAQAKILKIKSIYWALKERPSTHFHMYLFPVYDWVKEKFGDHVEVVTTAQNWSKLNMNTPEISQEIDAVCEKIRKQLT